mmetsp:Transcript_739/g.1948  ORF Transcript_739/g.1948 Transcript_739/m.1948 type:complete len:257 (-) Transcript_739:1366-2136(-)
MSSRVFDGAGSELAFQARTASGDAMSTFRARASGGGVSSRSGAGSNRKLVYAEFVYYDREGLARDVQLSGDWDNWACAPLRCEAERLWKGVFVVPAGYHEFMFYVNGIACVSDTHPRTADGAINWRSISGSRAGKKNKSESAFAKHRAALRALVSSVSSSISRTSSLAALAGDASRTKAVYEDISDVASQISSSCTSETDEESQCFTHHGYAYSKTVQVPKSFGSPKNSWSPYLYLAMFLIAYLFVYATTMSRLRY